MFPTQLVEYAPQIAGLAALGFIVAFILKKGILRTLRLIDPLLLRLRLPIEIGIAIAVPSLIAFFFDGNVLNTVLVFNIGYSLGICYLEA
ncbi:MAG: hypothetical protein OXF62_14400 [Caldilineaceae bacterium]|nr:hypothetical protein [Caldilineaceae bacterium]